MDTTNTKARDLQICNTIVQQLGGGRALAMVGATKLGDVAPTCMGTRIRLKGCRKANLLVIQLDESDTYIVRLVKRTGGKWSNKKMDVLPISEKTVVHHEGIYADQLRGLVERETGLYLSL